MTDRLTEVQIYRKMENLSEKRRICVRFCFIPQRYLMTFMVALGIMNAMIIRLSFIIFGKYVVKHRNVTTMLGKSFCNFTIESHTITKSIYNWNPKVKTEFRNVFFYGYMIGHIPGGYMADKFGGKHVLGSAVLLNGLLTMMVPMIVKLTEEPVNLMIIRFLVGLVEGAIFPAVNTMISNWTPFQDRGKVSGIVYSAAPFGTGLNNMFTMSLMKIDWTYVFYVYGGIAVAWWMTWCLLCYSNPLENPFIGDNEKSYLEKGLAGHVVFYKKDIPLTKIATSLAVWSFIVIQFGHTWIAHSMARDLPAYMTQILRYDVQSSHLVSSLPYGVMGIITIILGFMSDFILRRRYVTINTVRKICTTIGVMGPAIFTLGASYAGCNRTLSMVMFTLALGQMSFYYAGTRPLALDLSPNFSGFIMGLVNGIAAAPGVVQTQISKMLTPHGTLYEWRKVFFVSLGIQITTNIFFVLFGTAKEQPWNNLTRKPKVSPEKDET